MENIDLRNFVCSVPFDSLEIHNNVYFLCCPSWLDVKIEAKDYSIKDVWNSDPAIEVRKSILDGSYKYCNKELCPYLSKLANYGIPNGPIGKKNESRHSNPVSPNNSPDYLVMNFDRTCNYKCPSCRADIIVENKEGLERIEKTIEEIDTYYSKDVKTLYITGSGDPFASPSFRNYLRDFNPIKYRNLKSIHLHTNASMWNEEMWNSMPNVHRYVNSCEISIDAGTRETYENKTRLGGNWDNLISNLKFINTIPNLEKIKTSFVVQDTNYTEMEEFYNLMYSIFGKKVNVFFGKITNWGTFSDGEFKIKQVWDASHPEHKKFVDRFNKIWMKPNLFHNMYEFIDTSKKSLI
jgi:MoaA/NifB/PqqE/SkfB family radical SAM enzyme